MKRGNLKLIFVIIILITLVALAKVNRYTYSYFTVKKLSSYEGVSGDISFNAEISEKYIHEIKENNQEVFGRTINIYNDGSNDGLLRILVIPKWVNDKNDNLIGDINFIKYTILDENKWLLGEDGYFYYRDLLGVKENINLDIIWNSNDISEEDKKFYNDKESDIEVIIEVIQPSKECYTNMWYEIDEEVKKVLHSLCEVN